jgi:hypothetical protein
VLTPAVMKKVLILLLCICPLCLWPVFAQSSLIGGTEGSENGSAFGPRSKQSGDIHEDRFRIVDQLNSVGIDDGFFLEFSREDDTGRETGVLDLEVFTGAFGWARTSIYGFDRGVGFDRGSRFDEGTGFDKGVSFDTGARVDTGAGFDSMGGFDRERALRIGEEREPSPFLFRREERFRIAPEKEDRSLTRKGSGRVERGLARENRGNDALSREKQSLEQELLKSQEFEISAFRPTRRAFFIKIAMFAIALLFLLAGTFKGLIPLRFYFFLTLLILILWNPMESLFISIIVGLSALLAPLLG